VYGPVRTVVWQGSAGDRGPYADQTGFEEVGRIGTDVGFEEMRRSPLDLSISPSRFLTA